MRFCRNLCSSCVFARPWQMRRNQISQAIYLWWSTKTYYIYCNKPAVKRPYKSCASNYIEPKDYAPPNRDYSFYFLYVSRKLLKYEQISSLGYMLLTIIAESHNLEHQNRQNQLLILSVRKEENWWLNIYIVRSGIKLKSLTVDLILYFVLFN